MDKISKKIIDEALKEAKPDMAVKNALKKIKLNKKGKLILVSAGKAAWDMADAAHRCLKSKISEGVVITKYKHSKGKIGDLKIFEAGHPVPDNNSFLATEYALSIVSDLTKNDTVLFLLSGGGSALFEKPYIEGSELQDITKQLLAVGANIVEINTIRKRLSQVKGGRFAETCAPAKVYTIVLSDIIGDPLDMIASGPAYPDSSTTKDAVNIIRKYKIKLSDKAYGFINMETPKKLKNVTTFVTGSVRELCKTAIRVCKKLGYKTVFLSDSVSCDAAEYGAMLGTIAISNQGKEKVAFISGGETVVHLKGNGKGGRNQEIALSSARFLKDCKNTKIFSVGSDGTDGPTDAAGGYVDEKTYKKLKDKNISIEDVLNNNDSYNALKKTDGLIVTGPTGTNVNDLTVLLIN